MRLTAFDTGQRHPSELLSPETRANAPHDPRAPDGRLTEHERHMRRNLVIKGWRQADTMAGLARRIGARSADVSKWLSGDRPVPDKYLERLEELCD